MDLPVDIMLDVLARETFSSLSKSFSGNTVHCSGGSKEASG